MHFNDFQMKKKTLKNPISYFLQSNMNVVLFYLPFVQNAIHVIYKNYSINLYACTIAQYTVKIVTNKRATKHERNVDPSRTCINRQRQNMSKTHAKNDM